MQPVPLLDALVLLNESLAHLDAPVLVVDPEGSARERIARRVHEASTRASPPFVAVDYGAVPELLLESDLFGQADRPGLLDAARTGTLLLGGVDGISSDLQRRVLRRVRDLGIRLVVATRRPLPEGTFRRDLERRHAARRQLRAHHFDRSTPSSWWIPSMAADPHPRPRFGPGSPRPDGPWPCPCTASSSNGRRRRGRRRGRAVRCKT